MGSVLAVQNKLLSVLSSIVFFLISLLLYQTTLNVAMVLVCFHLAIGLARREFGLGRVITSGVVAILCMSAALGVDEAIKAVHPIQPARLEGLFTLPETPQAYLPLLRYKITGLFEFMVADTDFFPRFTKYAFYLCFIVALGGYVAAQDSKWRAAQTAVAVAALVFLTPFAAFGITWPFVAADFLFAYRVLFALGTIFLGICVLCYALTPARFAPAWNVVFCALLFTFAVGLAQWQLYLTYKNKGDEFVAQDIAQRLLTADEFKPGLPLVIVGTLDVSEYLGYRVPFGFSKARIGAVIKDSVYAHSWSSERFLLLYVPSQYPSEEERTAGKALAVGRKPWPSRESVAVENGVMIVVLSTPPG
jgi:hypothetical protein